MNSITITNREFFVEHDDYTDSTSFLQCETIENVKFSATYEVYTTAQSSSEETMSISEYGSDYTLSFPSSDWNTEKFVVGNEIHIQKGGRDTTGTILSIASSTMYFSSPDDVLTELAITDGQELANLTVAVITPPDELIFKFGLVPNDYPPTEFLSLLDGSDQIYTYADIDGSFADMNYLGMNSADLGGVQVKYDGASGTYSEIFTFTVEHTFRFPHEIDAWMGGYTGGVIPTAFGGLNSFRYLNQLQFSNNISNPIDRKTITDSGELGSVGFKNQNFNGGTVNYELVSISYDTGAVPEVTGTTTVTAQIKNNAGSFGTLQKAYLYHSKLANSTEYSSNDNSYEDNFMIDSIRQTAGVAAVDSDIITDYTVEVDADDTLLNISFKLTYSETQQANLVNLSWMFLGIAIQDDALSMDVSNRVLLELDSMQITKSTDVTGLAENFNATFYEPHSQFTGYTNAHVWNNIMLTSEFSFDLTKVDTGDFNFLTNLKYDLVGYDGSDFFSLDTYTFPLGLIPVLMVGGCPYQVKNLETTRFMPVPSGSGLRDVELTMAAPASFEDTQEVSGKFSFTIPWQQWKENLDVPMVFYDGAIPDEFFNRNQRTSNYSDEEGFDIYVFLTASLNFNGVITNYTFYSDAFEVYDFDVDGSGNGWAKDSFKIYNADGDEVEDIISGELNKIEFVLTKGTGVTEQYLEAELVTEPKNNIGREWRLHSTLDWSETDNPLSAEDGETGVKIVVGSSTVTVTCLVDGDMLDSLENHNFYVHLYE